MITTIVNVKDVGKNVVGFIQQEQEQENIVLMRQCQQEGWAREGYLFTDTLPDVRTFQEKNKIK